MFLFLLFLTYRNGWKESQEVKKIRIKHVKFVENVLVTYDGNLPQFQNELYSESL
jgi:DNA polymerase sigma